MTIAFWCVLAAILLPLPWTSFAKFSTGFKPRDNHNPREYLGQLEGAAKRAHWAEQNTFESVPGFMAAVIIAHIAHASQGWVDALAVAYIALRLAYGLFYIADKAALRSLVWSGALACVLGLFVAATLA
jgi:uncharacterized MAPEG superfamily protein